MRPEFIHKEEKKITREDKEAEINLRDLADGDQFGEERIEKADAVLFEARDVIIFWEKLRIDQCFEQRDFKMLVIPPETVAVGEEKEAEENQRNPPVTEDKITNAIFNGAHK